MAADNLADEAPSARPERVSKLWAELKIDPIELALPGGVGYTLRAYRPAAQIAAPSRRDATDRDDTDRDDADRDDADRDDADRDDADRDDLAGEDWADGEPNDADLDDADLDDADLDDAGEAADRDEVDAEQEVPVFLGRKGRLYLFHSPKQLLNYVRANPEDDLAQVDTWPELVKRVRVGDIVPLPEDTYELDLVVENLRGGADAWDPTLIIKAGEVARDIGYALQVDSIQVALSPGSPLDDLDEALRAAESGGIGAFLAKRRLRKIPAQQSSLGWRTVIGKISSVTEWRD